jgi:hypothetical protein
MMYAAAESITNVMGMFKPASALAIFMPVSSGRPSVTTTLNEVPCVWWRGGVRCSEAAIISGLPFHAHSQCCEVERRHTSRFAKGMGHCELSK